MAKFAEHKHFDLTRVNNEILEQWNSLDIFHKSIDEKDGCPHFIFFEGPPSANGHPGIHHVLARSIKDTFNRYATMNGFQVRRKAGWDTHGLPVELSVEKELGITKADIDNKEVDDLAIIKIDEDSISKLIDENNVNVENAMALVEFFS